MTEEQRGSFASPFEHDTHPEEPPRGSVLAYQRMAASGVLLDYVSFRAGNGRWYTTGGQTIQNVSWETLWGVLRVNTHGAVRYATGWAELATPPRPLPALPEGVSFPGAGNLKTYQPREPSAERSFGYDDVPEIR